MSRRQGSSNYAKNHRYRRIKTSIPFRGYDILMSEPLPFTRAASMYLIPAKRLLAFSLPASRKSSLWLRCFSLIESSTIVLVSVRRVRRQATYFQNKLVFKKAEKGKTTYMRHDFQFNRYPQKLVPYLATEAICPVPAVFLVGIHFVGLCTEPNLPYL